MSVKHNVIREQYDIIYRDNEGTERRAHVTAESPMRARSIFFSRVAPEIFEIIEVVKSERTEQE